VRRMTVIVMPLTACACIAGCGDNRQVARTSFVQSAAVSHSQTSTSSPVKPLTRAQARLLVRAVNLRASDLPGFELSSEKEREPAAAKRLEHQLLHCVGGALSGHGLAEGSSKEYERETSGTEESIESGVSVAPTAAIAARELQAAHDGKTRVCLSRYVTLLFMLLASSEGHGLTASPVQISSLSLPAPGATGDFGWRMSGTISLHGIRVPFDIDIAGFVVGQAEVTLFAAGLPEPVPTATERRLLALLVSRAEAHGA
jgi:hypothetical protein